MKIPPGWATAQLRDIVAVVRGRVAPRDFPDMPYIGMENVEAHSMKRWLARCRRAR